MSVSPPSSSPRPAVSAPPRAPHRTRVVLGVGLVLAGAVWFADAAGWATLRWPLLAAGALLVVGVGVLATVRRGGHGGLVLLGIGLAVVTLILPSAARGDSWVDVGDHTVRPASAAELAEPVSVSVGSLTVDLRRLEPGDDPVRLDATVGLGELVVWLPKAAAADVRGSAGAGEVTVAGRRTAGVGVSIDQRVAGDAPPWQLDVSAGMGRVEVRR